jgi:hypothetical protein
MIATFAAWYLVVGFRLRRVNEATRAQVIGV